MKLAKQLSQCSSKARLAAVLLTALLASACSTVSNVTPQGTTDNPVFPDVSKTTFKDGSWPNVDNLRQMQPGMTREQIYNLLDRPHFAEGFQVHEWDYLFHFKTADGEKTCQYKVLFDDKKLARSFFWKPADCASVLDKPKPEVIVQQVSAPAAKPVVIVQAAPKTSRKFTLNGDLLFAFGSDKLSNAGQAEVKRVAVELNKAQLDKVVVAGFTDRIGADADNDALSLRRAQTVRTQLLAEGVNAPTVQALGRGKRNPVITSCNQKKKADLVACLAPNRRVEIVAAGVYRKVAE